MERWRTEPYIMITGSGRYVAPCRCLSAAYEAAVRVLLWFHACREYFPALHRGTFFCKGLFS